MGTRNRNTTWLVVGIATLLFAGPAWGQTPFDYESPTYVTGKTSTTITVFGGGAFRTLDCPSTGVLSIFCDVVDLYDTGGFEGFLPSDLVVAEADRGNAIPDPDWEIEDGCIDSISSEGTYDVFAVDDGSSTVDVYCDPVGVLGDVCDELEVDDCTHFLGDFFPSDHDIPNERWVKVIRAEE